MERMIYLSNNTQYGVFPFVKRNFGFISELLANKGNYIKVWAIKLKACRMASTVDKETFYF